MKAFSFFSFFFFFFQSSFVRIYDTLSLLTPFSSRDGITWTLPSRLCKFYTFDLLPFLEEKWNNTYVYIFFLVDINPLSSRDESQPSQAYNEFE